MAFGHHPAAGPAGWETRVNQDLVYQVTEIFGSELRIAARRVAVDSLPDPGADQFLRCRFAVDVQHLVAIGNGVARQTDDPLDHVHALLLDRPEHEYLTALRFPRFNDLCVEYGQAQTVGKLGDDDEIADQQRRLHRARRNLEGFEDERPEDQDNK